MLLNSFFYITSLTSKNGRTIAEIRVDPLHPIFEGHFPGQPVVPGVCMIEILKEVLQLVDEKKYRLETASVIKFLTMFSPLEFTTATLVISSEETEDQKKNVVASLEFEQHVFLKFKGIYIAI